MLRVPGLALIFAAVAFAIPAAASEPTRVDPSISTLFHFRARTGKTFPRYPRNIAFEERGLLPAIVRFRSPPDAGTLHQFERAGITWGHDRAPLASGAYVGVVSEAGVRALSADPRVTRVSCGLVERRPLPLNQSAFETGITSALRAIRQKDGTPLDGSGVRIADIDSGFFIFHPAFFRSDGGFFAFVDADKNGALTPGLDGVDLDEDGELAPTEVLQRLSPDVQSVWGNPILEPTGMFRPNLDYLYLDQNQNGKRDFGEAFAEDTPAYGEPLFVFDDANRDGRAETREKLMRLKTSKFAHIRAGTRTFVRGGEGATALIRYRPGVSEMHGTGVMGILAGGMLGRSRWAGLAPNADLLGVELRTASDSVSGIQWAIDHHASAILTEYAPYTFFPLDGSTEEEALLDAALSKGAVPVSPAGNLAHGAKHATIAVGETAVSLPLNLTNQGEPARMAMFTVLHRATERALRIELSFPGGTTVIPDHNTFVTLSGGLSLSAELSITGRGTSMTNFALLKEDGSAIAPGSYGLSFVSAGAPFPVDVYVGDDAHDWAGGLVFSDGGTDKSTLCHPATSDKTLAVGAFVLHDEPEFAPFGARGELARYSSQGPRLDGNPGIDIVAPDNPMAPARTGGSEVEFSPFGGTSGAGPHVAATVALLRQLYPNESGSELRERIVKGARRDAHVGEARLWGAGKVDLLGAAELSETSPRDLAITLDAPREIEEGSPLVLEASSDRPVEVRWDLDYDGVADTPWSKERSYRLADPPAQVWVRAEARDEAGNFAEETLRVRVTARRVGEATAPDAGTNPPAGLQSTTTTQGCGCKATTRPPGSAVLGIVLALWIARRKGRRNPSRVHR